MSDDHMKLGYYYNDKSILKWQTFTDITKKQYKGRGQETKPISIKYLYDQIKDKYDFIKQHLNNYSDSKFIEIEKVNKRHFLKNDELLIDYIVILGMKDSDKSDDEEAWQKYALLNIKTGKVILRSIFCNSDKYKYIKSRDEKWKIHKSELSCNLIFWFNLYHRIESLGLISI